MTGEVLGVTGEAIASPVNMLKYALTGSCPATVSSGSDLTLLWCDLAITFHFGYAASILSIRLRLGWFPHFRLSAGTELRWGCS